MAVGPAGWSSRGDPLTCTESAVAIGLANWANKNLRWHQAMVTRNVCFGLFFGFGVFSLFSSFWLLLSFLFGFIGLGIHLSKHPKEVAFPTVAITSHGWAKFGTINHLISPSVSQGIDMSVYCTIDERSSHKSFDHIESNQLRNSANDDDSLSITSLQALLTSEENYLEGVTKTEIRDYRLCVLEPNAAGKLGDYIITNFPTSANLSINSIKVTDLDTKIIQQTQEQIDWFRNVSRYNNDLFERVIPSLISDISPYQIWSQSLHEEGLNHSKIVLDSTQQGWDNSTNGVDAAEDALERSVAADIITQQETIQRDMERAEEKIREKEAEIEFENVRKKEELEHQILELGAQVNLVNRQVTNIQAIPINKTIELMTAYGLTKGGAGDFAVTSSVHKETYSIDNPAWATREAIVQLAKGEKEMIIEKQRFVTTQIEQIEGMKERMMENLRLKNKEQLERLEGSKKRALRAIRKDAREVRSLEKENVQMNELLRDTVMSFWLHPHHYLEDYISKLSSILSDIDALFARIKSSNDLATDTLKISSLSKHGGDTFYHHWIILNGDLYGDTRIVSPINFSSGPHPVSINSGLAKEYLNISLHNVFTQPLTSNSFLPALNRLKEVGVINPTFYKIVSKLNIKRIMEMI